MARKRIAEVPGKSTTGTAHSLVFEESDGAVQLTIVGHDGKKRHASIVMDQTVIDDAIAAFRRAKKTI